MVFCNSIFESILLVKGIFFLEKFPSQREPISCEGENVIAHLSSFENVGDFLDNISDKDNLGNEVV